MNKLMKFENKQFGEIRMVEIENKPYFIASDVAKSLGYKNSREAVKQHCRWVAKHDIPHPQSKNKTLQVNIIPEGDMYRLITNSELENAEKFEKWVFDEVLPQIRKTGTYMTELKGQEKMFKLMRSEINEMVSMKIKEIEEKCSDYYRPSSLEKNNISSYIKKRLGITKVNDEYELVKQRVLLKLGATKWEDIPVEDLRDSLHIIDESIRVIKLDRPTQQLSMFY